MASKQIKFGILGCAGIAQQFSRSVAISQNAIVYAIGSRSLEKASKFVKDNDFPDYVRVYGSYEAVLDDPDVDAVYLPLPTSLHLKWGVLVAEKKKHLLLEKPVALNVKELDAILDACEANGVQFMDGTMWLHHPRTAKMAEFLNDTQRFGQLKSVHSIFSFAADPDFLENDIRVNPDLDGLGALGDIGWYCIMAILWAADFELPKSVKAFPGSVLNKAGVIIECGASLHWEDGKIATFLCSFLSDSTKDLTAIGTKASLRLHDFARPFEEGKARFTAGAESSIDEVTKAVTKKPIQHFVTTDIPQDALMVKEFSRLVANVKLEGSKPDMKWPIFSRKTQLVMDAVKASIDGGLEAVEIIV